MAQGSSLKLVSLNIERSKHLDLVLPFIEREQPDVLCLQELMERDIPKFEELAGKCTFLPMSRLADEMLGAIQGCGIFSQYSVAASGAAYYVGPAAEIPMPRMADPSTYNEEDRAALWCDVEKGGERFRVATTHFTWTPNGAPDDNQRRDVEALLSALHGLGDFVLCGDFNAPRGGEIFAKIASIYTDNVPKKYAWSLDLALHRAGENLKQSAQSLGMEGLMVDGLFSTPGYICSEVKLVGGVSDHRAITATISRA